MGILDSAPVRAGLTVVLLCACGRIGFQSHELDAGTTDAARLDAPMIDAGSDGGSDAGPPIPWIDVPVQAVRLANDDGTAAASITPTQVAEAVASANSAYASSYVRLVFNPASDFVDQRSTLLNTITDRSSAQWANQLAAANSIAASYPGKVTVLIRAGWSSSPLPPELAGSDISFVVVPDMNGALLCGHADAWLFAHAIGHYLGLSHTFPRAYASSADAQSVLSGSPDVFDGDWLSDTPPDPLITTAAVQCTTSTTSVTLGSTSISLDRTNLMTFLDSNARTLSTLQGWRVRQGALVRTGQDIRGLLPGTFLPAFEGEALALQSDTMASPASWMAQTNMRSFVGDWTHDAQLWWIGGQGGWWQATLHVDTSGSYRVWGTFTRSPYFGIIQLSIDGMPAGPQIDLYAGDVFPTAPTDLGMHSLSAGDHVVRIDVTGQNTAAMDYGVGMDYLLLESMP